MAEHIPFPSIDQFRNVCKLVRERAEYDRVPLPTLTFTGTVKLHGTNASVAFDETGAMRAQSRTAIITPEADNAGFAKYVADNSDLFESLAAPNRAIFGEWCGGNIQKGVALNGLPKMFIVFAIKDGDQWLDQQEITDAVYPSLKTVFIFETYSIDVDFTCPEVSQNRLGAITEAVEKECPAGKYFGVSGVGEGVVWTANAHPTFNTADLRFKVKGEKHSETKVKTLAAVEVEKIENIRSLVDSIVTPHRLEKKLDQMKAEGLDGEIRNIGTFLKLTAQDVLKEESDTIAASGLLLPEVMQRVSRVAKDWYMQQL